MIVDIKPIRVLVVLLSIVFILTLISALGLAYRVFYFHDDIYYLIRWFNLDSESNVPTFYSGLQLIIASILLFYIGLSHKRMGNSHLHWLFLSFIFLYLSFDETMSFHEQFIPALRAWLNATGYLFFAWVVPYSIAVIVILLMYINFLRKLPKTTAILFLVSGGVYLAGALGMEFISGNHFVHHGKYNLTYNIYTTIEECLEMIGISLFIYSLVSYISTEYKSLEFRMNKST